MLRKTMIALFAAASIAVLAPDMDHVRPDFARHVDVGRSRGRGKSRGIRQQRLRRSDLNRERRKAGKIRKTTRERKALFRLL